MYTFCNKFNTVLSSVFLESVFWVAITILLKFIAYLRQEQAIMRCERASVSEYSVLYLHIYELQAKYGNYINWCEAYTQFFGNNKITIELLCYTLIHRLWNIDAYDMLRRYFQFFLLTSAHLNHRFYFYTRVRSICKYLPSKTLLRNNKLINKLTQ